MKEERTLRQSNFLRDLLREIQAVEIGSEDPSYEPDPELDHVVRKKAPLPVRKMFVLLKRLEWRDKELDRESTVLDSVSRMLETKELWLERVDIRLKLKVLNVAIETDIRRRFGLWDKERVGLARGFRVWYRGSVMAELLEKLLSRLPDTSTETLDEGY